MEIVECGEDILEDDLCVCKAYFSYGNKDKDPLQEMHFFGKDGKWKEKLENFNGLVPRNFEEKHYRVFCKNQEKICKVQKAVELFNQKNP